ncbi:MAG TPA: hypothetical protein VN598_18495 [Usitatibacter sp.]|nr:hypothetical protein [Usitatibacter sp.]
MSWRNRLAAVIAIATSLCAASASAQLVLFGATGSNGVNGILYVINQATGASTAVGPILVAGAPVSLTGLAADPRTGVLYGAVANGSPSNPSSLIRINQETGIATLVGGFGTAVSDINFSAAGTLYAWDRTTNALGTVNLTTAAVTDVGPSGLLAFSRGGGMSINGGTAFVSVRGTTPGTLDSVNIATGAGTTGPALTGAPTTDAFDAMAVSPGGVLFAVNTDRSSSPTTNFLVTINTGTGAVTSVGALPGDMDALAFAPLLAPSHAVPAMDMWALMLMAAMLAVAGAWALRSRQTLRRHE